MGKQKHLFGLSPDHHLKLPCSNWQLYAPTITEGSIIILDGGLSLVQLVLNISYHKNDKCHNYEDFSLDLEDIGSISLKSRWLIKDRKLSPFDKLSIVPFLR